MIKKLFMVMAIMFTFMVVAAPAGAVFAAEEVTSVIDADLTDRAKTYNPKDANAMRVNGPLKTVVQVIGGVGGTAFVLAIMYYALMIIFGSLNPQKSAATWKALLLCSAGAFIFFGAATFADLIAGLSTTSAASN